jgi:hypothetical protein
LVYQEEDTLFHQVAHHASHVVLYDVVLCGVVLCGVVLCDVVLCGVVEVAVSVCLHDGLRLQVYHRGDGGGCPVVYQWDVVVVVGCSCGVMHPLPLDCVHGRVGVRDQQSAVLSTDTPSPPTVVHHDVVVGVREPATGRLPLIEPPVTPS